MNMYLVNSFSLNMLGGGDAFTVKIKKLTVDETRNILAPEGHLDPGVVLAIGHADTAAIVGTLLGLPEEDIARMVEAAKNRPTIKTATGDKAIVAQYIGPRLPEGATTLPEGAKIEFFLVEVGL
jgi:hypothetical protein